MTDRLQLLGVDVMLLGCSVWLLGCCYLNDIICGY